MSAVVLLLLGQITTTDPIEAAEHDPVEVTSGIPVSDGWTAEHDWTVSKPARGRQYDGGRVFAVWAPPGEYEIRHKITAVNFEAQKIVGKVEYVTLTVRPRAPPPPGPTPTPPDPRPGPTTDAEKAAEWARQTLTTPIAKQMSAQVASTYHQIATDLSDGSAPTIQSAVDRVEGAHWPVPAGEFRMFARLVWNEWDRRVPIAEDPRAEAVKLLKAAGDGLELFSRR